MSKVLETAIEGVNEAVHSGVVAKLVEESTEFARGILRRPLTQAESKIAIQEMMDILESSYANPMQKQLADHVPMFAVSAESGPTRAMMPRVGAIGDHIGPLYDAVRPSIVKLTAWKPNKGIGLSTAWAVDSDGIVAASYHAVSGNPRMPLLRALLHDGSIVPAEVIARDKFADLALLKLDLPKNKLLQPLEISQSPGLPDQHVFTIGFPRQAPVPHLSIGTVQENTMVLNDWTNGPSSGLIKDKLAVGLKYHILKTSEVGEIGSSGAPTLRADRAAIGYIKGAVDGTSLNGSAFNVKLLHEEVLRQKPQQGQWLELFSNANQDPTHGVRVDAFRADVLQRRFINQ